MLDGALWGEVALLSRWWMVIAGCWCLPGCVIVQVSATNPLPGLSTVAVAPFFNLSTEPERVADGRRVALAYYAELQKTPGFQVIPVGVTEQAIRENQLQMNDPADALALCRILNCDAVVVGAITDYEPYFPPRLGLQIAWYSPYAWAFQPGIPIDPCARHAVRVGDEARFHQELRQHASDRAAWLKARVRSLTPGCRGACGTPCGDACDPCGAPGGCATGANGDQANIRGQSDPSPEVRANLPAELIRPTPIARRIPQQPGEESAVRSLFQESLPASAPLTGASIPRAPFTSRPKDAAPTVRTGLVQAVPDPPPPIVPGTPPRTIPAPVQPAPVPPPAEAATSPAAAPDAIAEFQAFDPREPFMAYTRLFDARDAGVMAALRDWLELAGDRRSGGWQAPLARSEDYLRFCSQRMIIEMLTLHGGEAQRRVVFKFRHYREP